MKNLLIALIVFACPLSLWADNLIQNGNFADGGNHWEGDGKTPAAYAKANPTMPPDPLTSKGLIVTLNPTAWTRVYQLFSCGGGTQFSIAITYELSSDAVISKDAALYADISKKIQIPGFEHYGSIAVQPGQFYGTVGDPESPMIVMEVYNPKLGTNEVQTYQHTYPAVAVTGTKTFGLAFPPGTGTVTILSAAVTSN